MTSDKNQSNVFHLVIPEYNCTKERDLEITKSLTSSPFFPRGPAGPRGPMAP